MMCIYVLHARSLITRKFYFFERSMAHKNVNRQAKMMSCELNSVGRTARHFLEYFYMQMNEFLMQNETRFKIEIFM